MSDTYADGSERSEEYSGPYLDVTKLPVDPPARDTSRLRETRLFDDYDGDDDTWNHLTSMWQFGLLEAEWDDEEQVTRMRLTEFGAYLCEYNLVKPYLEQQHRDVDDLPPAVEVLQS